MIFSVRILLGCQCGYSVSIVLSPGRVLSAFSVKTVGFSGRHSPLLRLEYVELENIDGEN